jgi:trehalose-6-phosphatase
MTPCNFLQVYRTLAARTAPIPGATVENNKFCLSVHFRCVQEEVNMDDFRSMGNEQPAVILHCCVCV